MPLRARLLARLFSGCAAAERLHSGHSYVVLPMVDLDGADGLDEHFKRTGPVRTGREVLGQQSWPPDGARWCKARAEFDSNAAACTAFKRV